MNAELINRVGFNGCRYVASVDRSLVVAYCTAHKIPESWIRYSIHRDKHYLRLWGRHKKVGK